MVNGWKKYLALMLLIMPIANLTQPGDYKIIRDGNLVGRILLNYSNAETIIYPEFIAGSHTYKINNKEVNITIFDVYCTGYNGINCTVINNIPNIEIPYKIECLNKNYTEEGKLILNTTGKTKLVKDVYCRAKVEFPGKRFEFDSLKVYVDKFYSPVSGTVEVYEGDKVILKKVFNAGEVTFPELKKGEYIIAVYTNNETNIAILRKTVPKVQQLSLQALTFVALLLIASLFVAFSD